MIEVVLVNATVAEASTADVGAGALIVVAVEVLTDGGEAVHLIVEVHQDVVNRYHVVDHRRGQENVRRLLTN